MQMASSFLFSDFIWISTEVRSYMHMRTFFQQNPPLVFGRALLLKSKIHYISIDLDHGA